MKYPRPWFLRPAVIGSLLLVATLGGSGWWAWKAYGPTAAKSDEYIVATVQRGDIEDLVGATGLLQPRDYVDVGAQVSGQLRKIHVEVGSEVRDGELLAEIDAEQSAARVDANRASLRAQQATLIERQVNLAKAERDLQRQKNLMAEQATTAELLQNAETTLNAARTQLNALKAQIEQTQASMRVEEANLKYTKIYAPMAGTVVSITARQGQTLNTNQAAPTLLRIADLSTMTVQTQVSEADVGKLRSGMPSYFTTLGSQGRRWNGTLRKVEPTPTVTNNVVLYNALFDVPNPNNSLMTQMTAQVFFVAAEARDVLVVPMSALTLQRGAGAGRRERGAAGADAAAPRPSSPASGTAMPVPAASAARIQAGAGDTPQERPRFDREAWNRLSEEERERLRAERRAARAAAAAEGGASESARGRPGGAEASDGRPRTRDGSAPALHAGGEAAGSSRGGAADRAAAGTAGAPSAAGRQTRAAAAADEAPRRPRAAAGDGLPTGPGTRAPRRATVKVVAADGTLQEREVLVGISNRVHAQVLSGLQEGERVVAGVKMPDAPRRTSQPGPQGGVGQQGGGFGSGAGGGARSGGGR